MRISPISQSYQGQSMLRSPAKVNHNPEFRGAFRSSASIAKSLSGVIIFVLSCLGLGVAGAHRMDKNNKENGTNDVKSDQDFVNDIISHP